ncbi:MAG TPA: ferritin-like protein [Candidatus Limnocylindrales bacterium]|nr:ferritin-like protein [Candidatus Limnocylindrales bacterium]
MEHVAPKPQGPLAHVLDVRRGPDDAATGGLEHREALIYTLGKAAELEHLVMLQYLFAAFSLKQKASEGLSAETAAAVARWRKTLFEISEQEMLHLALVQNLLTAVGAAPRLTRPNFPMPAYAYPAGVRIELVPFGEAALRHFAFLERPEGMHVDDAEGFAAVAQAVALAHDERDEIVPHLQEFDTIGQLYRSIQAGFEHLQGRLGAERLFVGPPDAQATEEHFRWPELVAVTDLDSAVQAIDTIVEQGEGARGEWRDAHFGRLLAILDEYLAIRAADPTFEPARPVVAANVRPQATGVPVPLITDPGTVRCMDLLNVTYEVLLQVLSRYFAHADETPAQLAVLADVSVSLMYTAIKPLGSVVTSLPVTPGVPGRTAGPGFELFYQVDYLLPHRAAAWVLMEERLRDAAAFARRCGELCTPVLMEPLARVATALETSADQLLAAS